MTISWLVAQENFSVCFADGTTTRLAYFALALYAQRDVEHHLKKVLNYSTLIATVPRSSPLPLPRLKDNAYVFEKGAIDLLNYEYSSSECILETYPIGEPVTNVVGYGGLSILSNVSSESFTLSVVLVGILEDGTQVNLAFSKTPRCFVQGKQEMLKVGKYVPLGPSKNNFNSGTSNLRRSIKKSHIKRSSTSEQIFELGSFNQQNRKRRIKDVEISTDPIPYRDNSMQNLEDITPVGATQWKSEEIHQFFRNGSASGFHNFTTPPEAMESAKKECNQEYGALLPMKPEL